MSSAAPHRLIRHGLAIGLLASALHLGWEYTHGGVASHHLLARADMPAVSNWWGLIVLPLLGWAASRSALGRAARHDAARRSTAAFFGALIVGLALSLSFAAGLESAASAIFLAALGIGVFLPTYRAECLFGFVLGMTFVLGSVLPMMFALVGAAISAAAHFMVQPVIARLWKVVRA